MPALAAPLLAAPLPPLMPAAPPADPPANPLDPRLPPYSGAHDPELWIRQCKAAFAAHNTPEDRKGLWMITALRDEAASFWLMQCADSVTPTAHHVADKLRARFRPPSYQHNLMARLTALKMQSGNFSAYVDTFLLLTAQITDLTDSVKQSIFLNGLAPTYRLHVTLGNPTHFDDLLELARRVDASLRSQPAPILHPAFETANTAAARFRTNSRPGQPFSFGRQFNRPTSARGSGPPRSNSRQSRPQFTRADLGRGYQPNAPASRGPSRDRPRSSSVPRVICNICSKPGHYARDCYQNPAAQPHRGAANAYQQNRGRGRGGGSQRGRGRATPPGNASR